LGFSYIYYTPWDNQLDSEQVETKENKAEKEKTDVYDTIKTIK